MTTWFQYWFWLRPFSRLCLNLISSTVRNHNIIIMAWNTIRRVNETYGGFSLLGYHPQFTNGNPLRYTVSHYIIDRRWNGVFFEMTEFSTTLRSGPPLGYCARAGFFSIKWKTITSRWIRINEDPIWILPF